MILNETFHIFITTNLLAILFVSLYKILLKRNYAARHICNKREGNACFVPRTFLTNEKRTARHYTYVKFESILKYQIKSNRSLYTTCVWCTRVRINIPNTFAYHFIYNKRE